MRIRTLKTNFLINTIGAVVPLFVSLITVPIYVHHIGEARYGVLSIVWVLLGYFGFLDLGLSRAATNALARLRDAPQETRARVLVTTLALNFGLGLFGGLCLAVFGTYLLQHVLGVPDALKPEIAQAFPWIVGLFPLALVSGVGIGALESREHFLLANVLQVSGTALGQIAPVILAVAVSPSLAIVIPGAVLARVGTVIAVLVAVHRYERPLSLRAFDRLQIRRLLSYGGWISLSGIIGPILTSLDQFVIGSILGIASVAHYAVPMNLVVRSQVFAAALTRTLFPRLSVANPEEAKQLASRALVALAYGYAAICAPAIILTPLFFRYWIGADFAVFAAPIAQILFFGAWINAVAFIPYALLQGQGRPDITGKFHTLEVIPFIAVLWGLTSIYGIGGAAIAWSLRCALDAACLLWAARLPKHVLIRTIAPPFLILLSSRIVGFYSEGAIWLNLSVAALAGLVATVLTIIVSDEIKRIVLRPALTRSIIARSF
jgi:O-antigen/teichoic acid export membrane protein